MVKAEEPNDLTDEGKRTASRAKIKIELVKSITNEEEAWEWEGIWCGQWKAAGVPG